MEPTPELAARLDADRWDAASAMTFEQRAMAGVAMFDLLVDAMRAGIRMQFPGIDPERVETILLQRLREARRDEQTS